jgi:hypothetical protein
MFCPVCATENDYGAKYCRSCGRDLQLVSEALTRRVKWTSVFATRLDDFFRGRLQRQERESMREGGSQLVIGLSLAAMGALHLSGFSGVWLACYLFLVALIMILSGFGNVWLSKRDRAGEPEPELDRLPDDLSIFKPTLSPATRREPLRPARSAGETLPDLAVNLPSSVTEATTRHLGVARRDTSPRADAEE